MCGIAGLFGSGGISAPASRLRKMLDSISHRGPDGEGIFSAAEDGVWLGHKRLAIIDVDNGVQPMANEDSSIQIVFNGCIYNYQELAMELGRAGHSFKTRSDTEVIIHAYEEWGFDCVKRFNGMWAFAIWDSIKGHVFCSRDRAGIKPFYYAFHDGVFAFASEIKAIVASGTLKDVSPDDEGLRQYLAFQFCLGDKTMFKGVSKLPPSHNLVLKRGGSPEVSRYWDISFKIDESHDESYFVDRLRWLLEDSVKIRLRSDVPLGAHLSGGLDSSAIVCLARTILGDGAPLKTFTGHFPEGLSYDERGYAKAVSEFASTEYLDVSLGEEDFINSIERIIWHMDEPAAGPGVFPQFRVSKLASEHVKVVLGGQGGDELFIGYARYLLAYLEECLKGAIEETAHRSSYVATLESIVPSLPSLENYTPMLKSFWSKGLFDPPARRYFQLMDRFDDSKRLLSKDFPSAGQPVFEQFARIFDSHDAAAMINKIFCFDFEGQLQSLLHVEDRTSMAWGLESRVPLLDYRLIEFMGGVPPVVKFKNGSLKCLFKKAIANLIPAATLSRKDKMGFPVPISEWLQRKRFKEFVSDILLGERSRSRGLFDHSALQNVISGEAKFGRSLWGALCLEIWMRKFIDRQA